MRLEEALVSVIHTTVGQRKVTRASIKDENVKFIYFKTGRVKVT